MWSIGFNGIPECALDDKALAVSLFSTWAARTARVLRAVPVRELTAEELIDFWADDQISYPDSGTDIERSCECLPARNSLWCRTRVCQRPPRGSTHPGWSASAKWSWTWPLGG